MPYTQLFYHLVWATKNRASLITPTIEPIIHNYMRTKAIGLGGTVYALNGVEDHVHMAAAIPAKIAVSTFIGQVKGVTSTRFNQEYGGDTTLYWQDGYGAFTVDGKRLPYIIRYIERQKEHHRANELIPILERMEGETGRPIIRDQAERYTTGYEKWLTDMMALSA
ncbi:MAG: IS200/IS605 family transposase [Anaerolinea sp.]|nr:IS200/IS605 family transposase [Anaerolinea sp.]